MKQTIIKDIGHLLKEWDWEKNSNDGLFPDQISFGSTKKVWWKCSLDHSWQASPNNRSKGQGCPVCAGRKIQVGYNDLKTQLPELAKEWDNTKNNGLSPEDVTAHSHKLVWWKCSVCGHEWKTSISNRAAGKGCPVCALEKQAKTKIENIIRFKGSFAEKYPELLSEWDYEKNTVSPYHVTSNSTLRVWWKCPVCSHSWMTSVYYRTIRKSGCPACQNKTVSSTNCLQALRPDLLVFWDFDANKTITPSDVTPGSNKKVWWKCERGHSWCATVTSVVQGRKCPICSGQKVLEGFNDLATVNPSLAREWHPTLNGKLTAKQVTAGSSKKKVWWLCPRGHEYQATVANRSNGTGCPICKKEQKTSFPEQAILFYLGKHTEVFSRYLLNQKVEIDIYLPLLKIGIEYDGYHFHQGAESRKKELRKDSYVKEAGITLFRIKEYKRDDEVSSDKNVIYCKYTTGYNYLCDVMAILSEKIFLTSGVCFPIDVNIARDAGQIYSQYIELEKRNSLATHNPDLAKEWHPSKNVYLRPEMVSYSSAKIVWWKGPCGHEWRSSIDNRSRGNGCPICAGSQILIGFNDLLTTHPQLSAEWCYEKNGRLTPTQVTKGSHKKVWWHCPKGHNDYESTICNRVQGKGCPICSIEKRSLSRNQNRIRKNGSLSQTHPLIAAEWNFSLNNGFSPDSVTKGSSKKVWWTCENGHTYEATIANRVHGRGCPICAGKKIIPGINDLVTLDSKLESEWNYSKNQGINPHTISPNSHKKAWWICPQGHEWEAEIKSRHHGSGCPYCAIIKCKSPSQSEPH